MKFRNTRVSNFEGALRGMRNPLASWNRSDSLFGISTYDNMPEYEVAYSWVEKMNPGLDHETGSFTDFQDQYAEWLRDNGEIQFNNKDELVEYAFIGPNDMDLAMRLCNAGSEQRKFLRQIQVCVDITAPLYWWKEFDTYKVGTAANSTSTMHKLASTPITLECFETDDYEPKLIFEEGIDDHGDTPWDYHIAIEDVVGEKEDNVYWPDSTLIGFLESLRLKYNETKDKRYWKELVRWLPEGWLQTRTVTMNYENLRAICHQRGGHKLTEWHQFIDWAHDCLPYAPQLMFGEEIAIQ